MTDPDRLPDPSVVITWWASGGVSIGGSPDDFPAAIARLRSSADQIEPDPEFDEVENHLPALIGPPDPDGQQVALATVRITFNHEPPALWIEPFFGHPRSAVARLGAEALVTAGEHHRRARKP